MTGLNPLLPGAWNVNPANSIIELRTRAALGLRDRKRQIHVATGTAQIAGDESICGYVHMATDAPTVLRIDTLTETLPGCARLHGELTIGERTMPFTTGVRIQRPDRDIAEISADLSVNSATLATTRSRSGGSIRARIQLTRSGPPRPAIRTNR
jgi:hypothetical protein